MLEKILDTKLKESLEESQRMIILCKLCLHKLANKSSHTVKQTDSDTVLTLLLTLIDMFCRILQGRQLLAKATRLA